MRSEPACGCALAAACWLCCGRCTSEVLPPLGLAAFVAGGLWSPCRPPIAGRCWFLSCLVLYTPRAGRTLPAGEGGSAAGWLSPSRCLKLGPAVRCRSSPEFPFRFIWVLGWSTWYLGHFYYNVEPPYMKQFKSILLKNPIRSLGKSRVGVCGAGSGSLLA